MPLPREVFPIPHTSWGPTPHAGDLLLPQEGNQQLVPLTHVHTLQVIRNLMPVCTFFLEGLCSNPYCPYLHVNYGPDTPVCRAYLRGYCPRGALCPKRHVTAYQAKMISKATAAAAAAGAGGVGGDGTTRARGAVAGVVNMEGGSVSRDSGEKNQQQGRGAAGGGLKRGRPPRDAKQVMLRGMKRVRAVVGLGC